MSGIASSSQTALDDLWQRLEPREKETLREAWRLELTPTEETMGTNTEDWHKWIGRECTGVTVDNNNMVKGLLSRVFEPWQPLIGGVFVHPDSVRPLSPLTTLGETGEWEEVFSLAADPPPTHILVGTTYKELLTADDEVFARFGPMTVNAVTLVEDGCTLWKKARPKEPS